MDIKEKIAWDEIVRLIIKHSEPGKETMDRLSFLAGLKAAYEQEQESNQ